MSRDTGSDDEIAKALLLENVTGVFGLINDTIGYSEKVGKVRSILNLTSPSSQHRRGRKKEERTYY